MSRAIDQHPHKSALVVSKLWSVLWGEQIGIDQQGHADQNRKQPNEIRGGIAICFGRHRDPAEEDHESYTNGKSDQSTKLLTFAPLARSVLFALAEVFESRGTALRFGNLSDSFAFVEGLPLTKASSQPSGYSEE